MPESGSPIEPERLDSPEGYFQLVELTLDAVLVTVSGLIEYVNPAGVRLLGGASSKDIVGRSISRFISDFDKDMIAERPSEVYLAGPVQLSQEAKIVGLTGRVREVELASVSVTYQGRPGRQLIARQVGVANSAERQVHFQAQLLDSVRESLFATDLDGKITYWSNGAEALHGYTSDQAIGRSMTFIDESEEQEQGQQRIRRVLVAGQWNGQLFRKRRDGSRFWADTTISVTGDERGRPHRLVVIERDTTERRRLREEFNQSQKLESIGRLTEGVAHDFNNLLTAIISYAQLGAMSLRARKGRARESFEAIHKAAERATYLTRQLLGLSQRRTSEPRALDLGELIVDMADMLRRLLDADIELVVLPAQRPATVWADPGQIDQVLINLVVNGRDAMPEGGKLVVQVGNTTLDADRAHFYDDINPGEYVRLSVTDSGTGMTDDVMSQVFEPFFTTKEVGQGTGLGLSTCRDIVSQVAGYIAVSSGPSEGSTFELYLPRIQAKGENLNGRDSPADLPRGSETVLLAEDEPLVRDVASRVLREHGYTVFEAINGAEAIRLVNDGDPIDIDLLLTDVVMPLIGGKEVAERLRELQPRLKVLFTSGYADEALTNPDVLENGTAFMQKPILPEVLTHKVRDLLDEEISA